MPHPGPPQVPVVFTITAPPVRSRAEILAAIVEAIREWRDGGAGQ